MNKYKYILTFLFIFCLSNSSFSQSKIVEYSTPQYEALNGQLKVIDNTFFLFFQNNEFNYLKDTGMIVLEGKNEVMNFYNDLSKLHDMKNDMSIINEKYRLENTKNNIFIFTSNEYNREQYMMMAKKYSKVGMKAIEKSLEYLK
jgi:hypothetical protein